ncbi:type 1 glutamine amidotransferase [Mumia zhuanghuii]|uniref:Type 1 glutamine amidotransferase n=2 Tax=Mumia TaxID=1546255 RepID=A0ABW1QG91_9ACTN|nr:MULTISPECIES: type 1 glutamine amidotransferase [Mumia]KAA1422760.1 type 1 glutamine amidotransferase [Mumia zhuanghuii]
MSPLTEADETARPAVLVVKNSPTSGPGRLVAWLEAAGVDSHVVDGADLPRSLDAYDGVVTLGGGFMPDADERAPWLPRERELTVEALKREVPLLGICLGAQMLALCAGGQVTADSGETERGSCPVDLLPAAADDPVFAELAAETSLRMIQNHCDSVTALPAGADLLATSDACAVQAFRVGVCAWGLQFHPETGHERLRTWNEAELANDGFDRAALVAAAEADAEVNERQSRTLVEAFARVVRDSAQKGE